MDFYVVLVEIVAGKVGKFIFFVKWTVKSQ